MDRLVNRRKVLIAIGSVFLVLAISGLIVLLSRNNDHVLLPPSLKDEATPSQIADRNSLRPTATSTPGLVLYGKVIDQKGFGVADVLIYRNYSSYPGEVIATTDANGYYASDFYQVPGDEMVGVWAEKAGLVFEPEYYRWRHYYGYERKECNFLADLP